MIETIVVITRLVIRGIIIRLLKKSEWNQSGTLFFYFNFVSNTVRKRSFNEYEIYIFSATFLCGLSKKTLKFNTRNLKAYIIF